MLAAETLPSATPAVQRGGSGRVSGSGLFWYAGYVRSSISIVLFFLLSGFFLSALLGALEHSRKLLGIAAGCLVAVACVIVFLTPVQLPSLRPASKQGSTGTTIGTDPDTAVGTTLSTAVSTTVSPVVSTTIGSLTGPWVTTEVLGAQFR